MKKGNMLSSRKCSECGKEFIPAVEHLYVMLKFGEGKKWYCSYTCWRANGGDNKRWRRI